MTLNYQSVTIQQSEERMLLTTPRSIEIVDLSNVLYLEAFESSTRVHFTNRAPLLSLSPMRTLLSKFGGELFFQCHKSYAINLSHLQRYLRNGDLVLSNDLSLPLARRRRAEFLCRLEQYYES